jgi:hypothetical protein
VTARYQFLGHDVPENVLPRLADNLTLYDTWQRTHVVKCRTQDHAKVPPRKAAA